MLLIIIGALTIYFFYNFYWKRRNYPVGPAPVPILGNVTQLNLGDINVAKFKEWKTQFGDVYTIWFMDTPAIILSTYELFYKYLVRNGEKFSDRFEEKSEMVRIRGGFYGILKTSGERWRKNRKFTLRTLGNFEWNKKKMEDKIITEIDYIIININKQLTQSANNQDKNSDGEIDICVETDRAVGSVINNIVCGKSFTNKNEQLFYDLKEQTNTFARSLNSHIARILLQVDFLNKYWKNSPVNVGSAAFQSKFDYLQKEIDEHQQGNNYASIDEPSDFIDAYLIEMGNQDSEEKFIDEMGDSVAEKSSEVGSMDEQSSEPHFSLIDLKNCCYDLWFAGQETTASVLQWTFAYLIVHPEVQQKVHEELDEIIGENQYINICDRPNLHYTNAVICECMRCANIILLNVPRATNEAVDIEGVVVPKGTMVIPHLGMLLRDEKVFPDPNCFNPSRFLNSDGKFQAIEEFMPFSMGKRQCLGEGLAKMELFLFVSNLLNEYKLLPGKELPTLQKKAPGALGHMPFTCRVEKRY